MVEEGLTKEKLPDLGLEEMAGEKEWYVGQEGQHGSPSGT